MLVEILSTGAGHIFTDESEGIHGFSFITVLSKLKDFSKSQAVMCTSKALLSRKWRKIYMHMAIATATYVSMLSPYARAAD